MLSIEEFTKKFDALPNGATIRYVDDGYSRQDYEKVSGVVVLIDADLPAGYPFTLEYMQEATREVGGMTAADFYSAYTLGLVVGIHD